MTVSRASSLRDVQQSLLWDSLGIACFSGTVGKQRLRIRWNAPLRALYALPEDQTPAGGPLHARLIDVADRERVLHTCNALITTGKPVDMQFRLRANASKLLRVVIRRAGESNRIAGAFTDCTAKREELHHATSHNLWQSVGRLTLLDEVTSAMAHELNQPLAAITMFAQVGERVLAAPEPRLEKARQIFTDVSQQALRAGDLIHNMRSLIKRHAPSKVRLRVVDLLKGFASLAEPMARTHHVVLEVEENLPVVVVLVDVAQINQVLSILFQNALDAVSNNDTKQKIIKVAAEQAEEKIIISVTDSGPGVPDDAAPQLFQPFFSTKENGNGLGLVSARNILEIYSSRLEFRNLPQGGCRFSFFLPIESHS